MFKRVFDIFFSLLGLVIFSPVLIIFMILIYLQDKHSPFYIAPRVGLNGKLFNMIKLRSMVVDADKTGVDSTADTDNRITKIGHLVRKYKLDELTQLINVLKGDMSFVGPRPNVLREIKKYTEEEQKLLTIKPGITDFASIVFSDEGSILANKQDPDLAYNQLIRPWKSQLGILYIRNQSFLLDIKLIILTIISFISKNKVLYLLNIELKKITNNQKLIDVCKRNGKMEYEINQFY